MRYINKQFIKGLIKNLTSSNTPALSERIQSRIFGLNTTNMSFNRILIFSLSLAVIILIIACLIWCLNLNSIASLVSIFTPIILSMWFYYSQKRVWSNIYFDQIDGIYAGYTSPTIEGDGKFTKAGLIFNIRDTDNSGYFKGELDYAELKQWSVNQKSYFERVIEANYTFLGQMEFKLNIDKRRHPFKPVDNRIYNGTLRIVDRLDFQFENYRIEDYVSAEYSIKHYREMQTMKFTIIKKHKPELCLLPDTFTLYKKLGLRFEPYTSVKSDIFEGSIFSD